MAYRTVAECKQFAAQMLGERELDQILAGDTTEGTHDLLERWLTRAWDRISSHAAWPWLQDSISLTWPAQTTSGAGSILYLPHYIYRILSLKDPNLANFEYPVRMVEAYTLDHEPRLVYGGGSQDNLVIWGYYGVENDMPADGTIDVSSDAGAADENLQVRIEGLTATGDYQQIETVTLDATGNATTTNSFKGGQGGVIDVYIVNGTVPSAGGGIVTVSDNASATTLARLDASRERKHENLRTELYAQSTGASTFRVRYIRRPFNVTVSTDLVPVPNEFSDIIENEIMYEIHMFREHYGAAQFIRQTNIQRMKELRGWSNRKIGQAIVPRLRRLTARNYGNP